VLYSLYYTHYFIVRKFRGYQKPRIFFIFAELNFADGKIMSGNWRLKVSYTFLKFVLVSFFSIFTGENVFYESAEFNFAVGKFLDFRGI